MTTRDLAPIVKTIEADCSQEVAFKTFTEGLGSWWPLEKYSIGEDKIEKVVFDDHVGGRLYEVWKDGHEESWADILVWDPPRRVVLAWHPNPDATVSTEVEITFAEAAGTTTLRLEHRNWELLGDLAETSRGNYDSGWPGILELFRGATA